MLGGSGIYAIENVLNGRVYVGSTKAGIAKRWKAHVSDLHQRFHGIKSLRLDATKRKALT